MAVTARLLALPLDPARQTPAQQREFEELALSAEKLEALKRFACWQRLPLAADQDPYIGGMMHDIGKAALVQAFPGLFPTIVDLVAQQWQVPMLAAEEEVAGGANHSSVGRILAANWKLGPEVERVVANHHPFPSAPWSGWPISSPAGSIPIRARRTFHRASPNRDAPGGCGAFSASGSTERTVPKD